MNNELQIKKLQLEVKRLASEIEILKSKHKQLMSQQEVAIEYGLSRTTLYRMRLEGKIKSYRQKNKVVYLRRHIEQLILNVA